MKSSNVKTEFDKILIIQTAFIGDTALSLFLAQSIKNCLPNCSICYLTTPAAASLIEKAECVSRVFSFDKRGSEKYLRSAKAKSQEISTECGKLSAILSLHRSARTSMIVHYLNSEIKAGWENSAFSFVYNHKVKYYPCLHEAERNAQFLSALKIDLAGNNIFPKVGFKMVEIPAGIIPNEKYCVISPGSVWETKRWAKENFRKLVGLLEEKGYIPVITGSKSEYEICGYTAEGSIKAVNTAGKLTLAQTLRLIGGAAFIICNDSAPTHLAALAGTRTITIYGATSPLFGFYPPAANSVSCEAAGLECHPCEIHGSKFCPKKMEMPECMMQTTPEKIMELIEKD